jgi:hypothetical protein
MNTNQLVLFSVFLLYSEMICLKKKMVTGIIFIYQPKIWLLQVFTNSDKAHAEEALCRLGLQGCFDGVICFETLNPCNGPSAFRDGNGMLFPDETFPDSADLNESDGFRPISPILCKPSIEAMEAVTRIANVDPKKTVRTQLF